MRKLLALLCMVVFIFGTALCEETQAVPPEDITILEVPEQEQVPSEEPILEEPIPTEEEEPPIESPPIEEPQEELEQEEPEEPEEPIEEPVEEPVESEVEEPSETPTEVIEISEEILTTPMPEPIEEEEPTVEELSEFEDEIESEEVIVPEELVEIAEGDWGYVDPEMMPREVHISFLTEPRFFGDEAALVLTLVNFRSDDVYTIHWQYCEDVNNPIWQDIPGANARVYTFIVDKTNYLYGYRVLIEMEE